MGFKDYKKIIVVIGGLLLVVILWGIFSNEKGPQQLKGAIQSGTALVTNAVAGAAEGIESGVKGIFQFKEVVEENKRLQEEITKVHQEKIQTELNRKEKEELEALYQVFRYKGLKPSQLIAANVTAMDYSTWKGVFTIDMGTEAGIKKGCIVVCENGLVGRVLECSQNTAKVTALFTENNKISFQIKGREQEMGVVQGDGKNGLTGYLLGDAQRIKTGDTLVTSGIGTYPEGITIGKVSHVEKKNGTQSISIKVMPQINLYQLKKVAVVL